MKNSPKQQKIVWFHEKREIPIQTIQLLSALSLTLGN